jgi:hypothetical protein
MPVAKREARGRAARKEVPRSGHAALELEPGREPIAILELQNRARLPSLVPIGYGQMLGRRSRSTVAPRP